MPIANLMVMAMCENAIAAGTTTRCSLCFVVCALGVCANERKNVHDKRKKTRLHSWRACVLCLLLLSRPFYDTHSYILTCKYVCLPVRCQPPCPLLLLRCPNHCRRLSRQAADQFLCLYTRMSSHRGCCCRCCCWRSAGLLAILHLLFSISRLPPPPPSHTEHSHTHICMFIHTYIPELTGNRQRLYFIISLASLGLSRVSCCLWKGRGPSRIEYA